MHNKTMNLEDQREISSYRSRMNSLRYNTPGTSEMEYCECPTEMTNENLLYLQYLK